MYLRDQRMSVPDQGWLNEKVEFKILLVRGSAAGRLRVTAELRMRIKAACLAHNMAANFKLNTN